ncbi:MAG: helicase-exonuclease AddAB subunit AddA [Oscillospiraceae bacterium]|jgi:ATP-dependent helicase/nuclease subunit A|nr:helicase-exonuclease AddAB subunit AddA [Oscillospiraceae bacterium]
MTWTTEQLQAIEARGGGLLVSAAAGSGKTAVLVERVLRLLTDPVDPCAADELLIVTFTRLAAGEMRERIHKALGERLKANPGDVRLLRQQQLLPLAQICTIDSFCMHLVKEHFSELEIPPELRLLDESERRLWQEDCARAVLEEAYKAEGAAFKNLGLLLELGGDDQQLLAMLRRTAELALATPAPVAWLQNLPAPYRACMPPEQSPWGKIILEQCVQKLGYLERMTAAALALLREDEALLPVMTPAIVSDAALLAELRALAEQGAWDPLRTALAKPAFARMGFKKGYASEIGEACKARRSRWKDEIKALGKRLCVSAAEHQEDAQALLPLAEVFVALTESYLEKYSARKREKRAADFGDLLHWALALLLTPAGEKTSLAEAVSGQYREILVDEYQDVNAAQGRLFEALSRGGENLFFVGDVKQSIYRFRQANPELFLEKRRSFAPFDGATYPACLILGRNFRSRPGVTEAVNFTFSQLMHREAAEMDYTAEEALFCARAAEPGAETTGAELHLLESGGANQKESLELEARHAAQWIAETLRRGECIYEKGKLRPLRPRDFCILLRSDKHAGAVFVEAMRTAGVPAHSARTQSLFARREVQFLLSLLRVIDNPLVDIPLLGLLLSPVFGFTPAQLARLRAAHPGAGSLWQCLCAAEKDDPACAAFLAAIRFYRQTAAVTAPGDLIRWLLEETGMLSIAAALPRQAGRRANLHRLEEYALVFTDATGAGLSGFLRYMEQIESGDALLAVSEVSESADVVRVMSIHKSKGLEFPVCILAQCGHGFNTRDAAEPLLLHAQAGLGLQRPEPESRRRLPTLPHQALQEALLFGTKSEELRLLYVAMTRAREKLLLLCTEKDAATKLQNLAARQSFTSEVAMEPQAVRAAGSYADWLLGAALRHPDAHALREAANIPHSCALPCAAPWRFSICPPVPPQEITEELQNDTLLPADPALLAEIRRRMEYRYPFEPLTLLPAKRAVSELTEQRQREKFAFTARPAFLQKGSLTAAQKGTAMHAFLQYADYIAAAADLPAEVQRLAAQGFLTPREAQALELDKLRVFFAGSFARRMLQSPRLLREQKFTLRIPAAELPGSEAIPAHCLQDAETIVQGIIDCAFEENGALVLLDYKTDRVDSMEELRERYAAQLQMYRHAMERCFGLKVSELLIYSFWLGDWVEV